MVWRLQVVGRENLPANDEPAVYVANHQSFLVRTPCKCLAWSWSSYTLQLVCSARSSAK